MPRITIRVSADVYERLLLDARAQDRELERELGQPPVRRTTVPVAAARLLEREFDRREAKARRARDRRRSS